MIFVTVGSMFPFDRLIELMDRWALAHPDEKIFAQIGDGEYLPKHMPYERMVTPTRFREIYDQATMIVAHAGMGSVISAAEIGKPIVLLPRIAANKEHTTDHQIHTAGWLRDRPGIYVADTSEDLAPQIEAARAAVDDQQKLPSTAPAEFIAKIKQALTTDL